MESKSASPPKYISDELYVSSCLISSFSIKGNDLLEELDKGHTIEALCEESTAIRPSEEFVVFFILIINSELRRSNRYRTQL